MAASAETARQNRPSGRMNGGRALAEMLRLSRRRADVRHGRVPAPAVLRCGRASSACGHYLINDERCGAFAADAYARVTNRPGVCDGTLGPGATNLVTGLIEALNGGIPIVAITGDTTAPHSWKNMTQEARQTEILRPAVKELIRVEQTSRIPELIRRAFAVATAGRPGPVAPRRAGRRVPRRARLHRRAISRSTRRRLPAPSRRIRPDRADIARAARADRQAPSGRSSGRRRRPSARRR